MVTVLQSRYLEIDVLCVGPKEDGISKHYMNEYMGGKKICVFNFSCSGIGRGMEEATARLVVVSCCQVQTLWNYLQQLGIVLL